MEAFMLALYIILGVLGGLFFLFSVFYFVTVTPRFSKREKLSGFISYKYAHRGLHGDGVSENSLTAFRLAVEAGYAIELDVRLTKDGEAVVFHDATVDRVTEKTGRVIDFTAEELCAMPLLGTEDCVPLFSDVLRLVAGRVPLLVELKEEPGHRGVAKKALEVLEGYEGDYIIESFNPMTLGDVRRISPDVITGILSTNYLKDKKYRKPVFFAAECFFTNLLCRPDFVSYNAEAHKNFAFRLFRGLFKVPSFAWTITSAEEEKDAYRHGFDAVIFEGYDAKNITKTEDKK